MHIYLYFQPFHWFCDKCCTPCKVTCLFFQFYSNLFFKSLSNNACGEKLVESHFAYSIQMLLLPIERTLRVERGEEREEDVIYTVRYIYNYISFEINPRKETARQNPTLTSGHDLSTARLPHYESAVTELLTHPRPPRPSSAGSNSLIVYTLQETPRKQRVALQMPSLPIRSHQTTPLTVIVSIWRFYFGYPSIPG